MSPPGEPGCVLGLHIARDRLYGSYVSDGRLVELGSRAFPEEGERAFWSARVPGSLQFFGTRDLVGVEVEGRCPGDAILAATRSLSSPLSETVIARSAIVLPASFNDSQRRWFLGRASEAAPTRALDAATATLFALRESQSPESSEETIVCYADDSALELSLARTDASSGEILTAELVSELSGRALSHHLLGRLVDRVPEDLASGLADLGESEFSRRPRTTRV